MPEGTMARLCPQALNPWVGLPEWRAVPPATPTPPLLECSQEAMLA